MLTACTPLAGSLSIVLCLSTHPADAAESPHELESAMQTAAAVTSEKAAATKP